ncbi:hypothetical protein Ancab_033097 [Ancistrocladus abbreviatus]
MGSHAVGGCSEFMPAGEEGTVDALKCAACNCHRNFHCKEIDVEQHILPPPTAATRGSGGGALYPQFSSYYRTPPPPLTGDEMEDMSHPSSSGGGGNHNGNGGVLKKRFMTKFTHKQKDKTLAFADKLGWRIQKHDEAAVQQFCREVQVRRPVLEVWMHNNKHTLGKTP